MSPTTLYLKKNVPSSASFWDDVAIIWPDICDTGNTGEALSCGYHVVNKHCQLELPYVRTAYFYMTYCRAFVQMPRFVRMLADHSIPKCWVVFSELPVCKRFHLYLHFTTSSIVTAIPLYLPLQSQKMKRSDWFHFFGRRHSPLKKTSMGLATKKLTYPIQPELSSIVIVYLYVQSSFQGKCEKNIQYQTLWCHPWIRHLLFTWT